MTCPGDWNMEALGTAGSPSGWVPGPTPSGNTWQRWGMRKLEAYDDYPSESSTQPSSCPPLSSNVQPLHPL